MSNEDGYVLCPRCKGKGKVEVEIAIADEFGCQIQGVHGKPVFRTETRPCPGCNKEGCDRPGYTYMPPRVDEKGKVHWTQYFLEHRNKHY